MFDVNIYAILFSFIASNILMLLFIFLSNRYVILRHVSPKVLIFITILPILRLIFSVEILPITNINAISSFTVIPQLESFLTKQRSVPLWESKSYNIIYLVLLIWISGAVISLAKTIRNYRMIAFRLKHINGTTDLNIQNQVNEIKARYNIKANVKVIINKNIVTPSEFGLFNQTILLPHNNYNENDLNIILTHEILHYKTKTNWYKLIISIITSIFWWDPVYRIFGKSVTDLLEIYCDDYALKNASNEKRKDYLKCMLSATIINKREQIPIISNFSRTTLLTNQFKNRVKAILYKKNNISANIIVISLLLIITMASYMLIIQPGYAPTQEEMTITTSTDDSSYILETESGYILHVNGEPEMLMKSISDDFKDLDVIKGE